MLLVEDDTDGQAISRLAKAAGLAVTLDWLPANGIGNLKRRGDKLIELARARVTQGRGCVAVVVDRDGKKTTRAEPHRSIRDLCKRMGVAYVEAVEAVEAWFLADAGISAWLGLPVRGNADANSTPKDTVARAFAAKTKRPYRKRRSRPQVAAHATGPESDRSPSWAAALGRVQECIGPK